MKNDVKKLRLADVILNRRGSFPLWLIHFIFGAGISIFFKRIELYNSENLPEKSGLIFVSNHPNALIDPALLFIALPRKIAFLAKSTLFKMPVIGYLIRTVGALPLYRQQDKGEDLSKNQETFAVARELLKKGGAIAIFPEGVSHDRPQLQPLKTGAARIALGAVSSGKDPASLRLEIVPVGLFYTEKNDFSERSLASFRQIFSGVARRTGRARTSAARSRPRIDRKNRKCLARGNLKCRIRRGNRGCANRRRSVHFNHTAQRKFS
jgi:1-acyl-sn-glycerol-3-phosphate acyltransferase